MKDKSLYYALFYSGVAFIIFWIFKPKSADITSTTKLNSNNSDTQKNASGADDYSSSNQKNNIKKIPYPHYSQDDLMANDKATDGIILLKAYIDAHNAGEPSDKMKELNDIMKQDYGMYIMKKGDILYVKDMDDNIIIENHIKYN